MSLIPPQFLDFVVALGVPLRQGGTKWIASGFLYGSRVPNEARYRIWLVTARHVFESTDVVTASGFIVRMNPEPGENAKQFSATLTKDGRTTWYGSRNPDHDVAVMALNLQALRDNGVPLRYFRDDEHTIFLDSDEGQHALSEGDGVFLLGFPLGQAGIDRNYAIVRSGSIARIRDALSNPSRTFLVDAINVPGNSGGVVLTRPETVRLPDTRSVTRSAIIGVVSAYVGYGPQGAAVAENSGLAVIAPIDAVRDLVRITLAENAANSLSQP